MFQTLLEIEKITDSPIFCYIFLNLLISFLLKLFECIMATFFSCFSSN